MLITEDPEEEGELEADGAGAKEPECLAFFCSFNPNEFNSKLEGTNRLSKQVNSEVKQFYQATI